MPRLFMAVWPPPAVIELLESLPRAEDPLMRWTTAAQWHITLRYLGDVDEGEARAALEATDGGPVEATLGPAIRRLGQTLVVPVAGLDHLAGAVELATLRMGERPHPAGFRGHLTLARPRDGRTTVLDGHPFSARFPVEEIALVHSELHPDGARYTTVTTRRLPA